MKKNKTLLIMAAGMGSRFGGLKQIEPMGPNNEFIIDYSIYDAKQAGFNKIVFIIKKENYQIFKETIGKRVEPIIKTEYVFQENLSYVPSEYHQALSTREKPLGTGHAILCAQKNIHEPFAVINADDFYGSSAFLEASKILDTLPQEKPYQYALIAYLIQNTMTENGSVKRGICQYDKNMLLTNIIESKIENKNNKILATSLATNEEFELAEDTPVSMNLTLFTPSFFPYLEEKFLSFLQKNKQDLSKCEFFMPDALFSAIKEKYATVKVYKTTSKWYGVTYKEDTPKVKEALKNMHQNKEYPQKLWKK